MSIKASFSSVSVEGTVKNIIIVKTIITITLIFPFMYFSIMLFHFLIGIIINAIIIANSDAKLGSVPIEIKIRKTVAHHKAMFFNRFI